MSALNAYALFKGALTPGALYDMRPWGYSRIPGKLLRGPLAPGAFRPRIFAMALRSDNLYVVSLEIAGEECLAMDEIPLTALLDDETVLNLPALQPGGLIRLGLENRGSMNRKIDLRLLGHAPLGHAPS